MTSKKDSKKEKFEAFVRFRVPQKVRNRLERLAKNRIKTAPELARTALVQFLDREELKAS